MSTTMDHNPTERVVAAITAAADGDEELAERQGSDEYLAPVHGNRSIPRCLNWRMRWS